MAETATLSSTKELAISLIRDLPNEVTLEDISKGIADFAACRKGQEDIKAGRFTTHEELKRQVKTWNTK
jgi:predicted transcriptional regulator